MCDCQLNERGWPGWPGWATTKLRLPFRRCCCKRVLSAICWWTLGHGFAYGADQWGFVGTSEFLLNVSQFDDDVQGRKFAEWFFQWAFAGGYFQYFGLKLDFFPLLQVLTVNDAYAYIPEHVKNKISINDAGWGAVAKMHCLFHHTWTLGMCFYYSCTLGCSW